MVVMKQIECARCKDNGFVVKHNDTLLFLNRKRKGTTKFLLIKVFFTEKLTTFAQKFKV